MRPTPQPTQSWVRLQECQFGTDAGPPRHVALDALSESADLVPEVGQCEDCFRVELAEVFRTDQVRKYVILARNDHEAVPHSAHDVDRLPALAVMSRGREERHALREFVEGAVLPAGAVAWFIAQRMSNGGKVYARRAGAVSILLSV